MRECHWLGNRCYFQFLWIEHQLFRPDVITEVTDEIRTDEKSLHEYSRWGASKIVMCNPDHCAYQHQLPEEFILLTKRGNGRKDGCSTAKDRQ